MSNFGKIILFRIEDLLPDVSENAAYSNTINNNHRVLPFVKTPFDLVNSWPSSEFRNYRICTKNYAIEKDGLKSIIFPTFGNYAAGNGGLNYINNYASYTYDPDSSGIEQIFLHLYADGVPVDPDVLDEQGDAAGTQLTDAPPGSEYKLDASVKHFLNHNLSISKPLTSNTNQYEKFGIGDSLKIEPVYNYYLKHYEDFYLNLETKIDTGLGKEKSIPNFYYLISVLADPSVKAASNANQNDVPFTISGLLSGLKIGTDIDYLKPLYTDLILKEQNENAERNSVVVLTPSFIKSMANNVKTQLPAHPFYNKISIPVQKGGTAFRDLLKKAKMYEQLQYRSALLIKILNAGIKKGLDVLDVTSFYNVIYTQAEETESGLKTIYKSSQKENNLEIDKFSEAPKYNFIPYLLSNTTPRIIEFNASLYDEDANNIDFKAKNNFSYNYNTNSDTYISLKNVSSRNSVPTPNGGLYGAGINFNFFKNSFFLDQPNAPVSKVTNPLTFYSGDENSENEYISSVIQAQANAIFEYIFNKAKLSTYSVLDNVQNYSEILFFEVQKYDTNELGEKNNLIQTFILPNDPDAGDMVEYIDSQILYAKQYIYSVYAHVASVGNKVKRGRRLIKKDVDIGTYLKPPIEYDGVPKDSKGNQVDALRSPLFEYENNYDVKMLRVPYFNTEEFGKLQTTFNRDKPPIPPQLTFFPYKNVSDKIGFWFNIGLGEMRMKFVSINYPDDILPLGGIGYLTPNIPIIFKTDDFGGQIEVFRTTERPIQYSDFKDKKIADIDVIGPRTLINDITPNQDYYYTFRHKDPHGLYSNPTPVYHLKMITADSKPEPGSVRLGVEGLQPVLFNELIYLLRPEEEEKVEKSFKKYLLLEPTLSQTYLSFDNFETGPLSDFKTANDIKINKDNLLIGKGGPGFMSVGGKKFKIRISSKQTGRKIDLNVDFKNLSVIENYKE